jgi:hypothetical protein
MGGNGMHDSLGKSSTTVKGLDLSANASPAMLWKVKGAGEYIPSSGPIVMNPNAGSKLGNCFCDPLKNNMQGQEFKKHIKINHLLDCCWFDLGMKSTVSA